MFTLSIAKCILFTCWTARLATTGKLIDGEDDDDNYFDDDWTWNSDRKPGLLHAPHQMLLAFFLLRMACPVKILPFTTFVKGLMFH